MYKVRYKNRTYLVKAKDSDMAVKKVKEAIGNEKDVELNDDRLSPMTYKKLKELGYGPNDWKNLTQEKANEIVASHAQGGTNGATKQAQAQTNTQTKAATSSNASKSTSTSTQSKQSFETSFTPKQINAATKIWGNTKDEVVDKLKQFVSDHVMQGEFSKNGFLLYDTGATEEVFQVNYLPNGSMIMSHGEAKFDENDANEQLPQIDPNQLVDTKIINNFSELGAYFGSNGYAPLHYEEDNSEEEFDEYNRAFKFY